jgi:hypothetical protein
MKRNRTPGKTKLFPAFPVPAGAPITSEMVREILEPSPLTLRAASIVMPLLQAKKVTPKMIRVLLEEVLKARKEVNSKSNRPDFTEYLSSIPKGPDVFDRIRDFHSRRGPLPKGESTKKLIKAGRRI